MHLKRLRDIVKVQRAPTQADRQGSHFLTIIQPATEALLHSMGVSSRLGATINAVHAVVARREHATVWENDVTCYGALNISKRSFIYWKGEVEKVDRPRLEALAQKVKDAAAAEAACTAAAAALTTCSQGCGAASSSVTTLTAPQRAMAKTTARPEGVQARPKADRGGGDKRRLSSAALNRCPLPNAIPYADTRRNVSMAPDPARPARTHGGASSSTTLTAPQHAGAKPAAFGPTRGWPLDPRCEALLQAAAEAAAHPDARAAAPAATTHTRTRAKRASADEQSAAKQAAQKTQRDAGQSHIAAAMSGRAGSKRLDPEARRARRDAAYGIVLPAGAVPNPIDNDSSQDETGLQDEAGPSDIAMVDARIVSDSDEHEPSPSPSADQSTRSDSDKQGVYDRPCSRWRCPANRYRTTSSLSCTECGYWFCKGCLLIHECEVEVKGPAAHRHLKRKPKGSSSATGARRVTFEVDPLGITGSAIGGEPTSVDASGGFTGWHDAVHGAGIPPGPMRMAPPAPLMQGPLMPGVVLAASAAQDCEAGASSSAQAAPSTALSARARSKQRATSQDPPRQPRAKRATARAEDDQQDGDVPNSATYNWPVLALDTQPSGLVEHNESRAKHGMEPWTVARYLQSIESEKDPTEVMEWAVVRAAVNPDSAQAADADTTALCAAVASGSEVMLQHAEINPADYFFDLNNDDQVYRTWLLAELAAAGSSVGADLSYVNWRMVHDQGLVELKRGRKSGTLCAIAIASDGTIAGGLGMVWLRGRRGKGNSLRLCTFRVAAAHRRCGVWQRLLQETILHCGDALDFVELGGGMTDALVNNKHMSPALINMGFSPKRGTVQRLPVADVLHAIALYAYSGDAVAQPSGPPGPSPPASPPCGDDDLADLLNEADIDFEAATHNSYDFTRLLVESDGTLGERLRQQEADSSKALHAAHLAVVDALSEHVNDDTEAREYRPTDVAAATAASLRSEEVSHQRNMEGAVAETAEIEMVRITQAADVPRASFDEGEMALAAERSAATATTDQAAAAASAAATMHAAELMSLESEDMDHAQRMQAIEAESMEVAMVCKVQLAMAATQPAALDASIVAANSSAAATLLQAMAPAAEDATMEAPAADAECELAPVAEQPTLTAPTSGEECELAPAAGRLAPTAPTTGAECKLAPALANAEPPPTADATYHDAVAEQCKTTLIRRASIRSTAYRNEWQTQPQACCHCRTALPDAIEGCMCGGGLCTACNLDSCACPWTASGPTPPQATRAWRKNQRVWGYLEMPIAMHGAPSILVVGEYSMAFAAACRARFPSRVTLTVDYRTATPPAGGLHYCGDVRDLLWGRRWWLIVGHPPCHDAALSNTTRLAERVDSGDVWRAMAFTLMLYCAPADTVIIEQPPTHFATAYRPPQQKLQFLDFMVAFSKEWWLWHRGAVDEVTPTGRTTELAPAPHRIRCSDKTERERLRSKTPPEMAEAVLAAINPCHLAPVAQPIFALEVNQLLSGFLSMFGGRGLPAEWQRETADAPGPGVPHANLTQTRSEGRTFPKPQPPVCCLCGNAKAVLVTTTCCSKLVCIACASVHSCAPASNDDAPGPPSPPPPKPPTEPDEQAPPAAPSATPRAAASRVSAAEKRAAHAKRPRTTQTHPGQQPTQRQATPLGRPVAWCDYSGCTNQDQTFCMRCGRCKNAAYCSRECQRADWPDHERICLPLDGAATDCAPDLLPLADKHDSAQVDEPAAVIDDLRNVLDAKASTKQRGAPATAADALRAASTPLNPRGLTSAEGKHAAKVKLGRAVPLPPDTKARRDTYAGLAPALDLTAPPAAGATTVAVVPVYIQREKDADDEGAWRTRLLALVPATRKGAYGRKLTADTRRGRRESMVELAAKWLPHLAAPEETYFLAGEVDTHDAKDAPTTVVMTAPLSDAGALMAYPAIASTGAELQQAADAGHDGVWATIDALAECATDEASVAAYRIAATAIAKVDSYMRPTADGPSFMRVGARAELNINRSASAPAAAEVTLQQRIKRAAAAACEFQSLLQAVPASDSDGGWSTFCHSLAPGVDTDPAEHMPAELLDLVLPAAPADILQRRFQHIAKVQPTEPLAKPKPQQPPEDGWWPESVEDIVEEWALIEINNWLKRYVEWHRKGGPAAGRPTARAFGTDAIKPRARGRVWDLRGGKGNVKLFDPTVEPKRTCLNLAFAEQLLADCKDRELLSMVVNGVQMKTEGMAHQIVLMPNLLSMYTAHGGVEAAAKQMAAMVEEGFMGIFDSLPCVPFRAVPRGEVPKKGTDELRGIADQGQPRKRLRTQRSDEPVISLNELSKQASWHHQDMDSLESAAINGAICQHLADLNGEDCIEMAFDFSKYFHRFFYQVLTMWQMGCIVPREGDSSALSLALEYVMSMGASPSSLVAQKFSNALMQQICMRMHAEEASRWSDATLPDELAPAARAALKARGRLEPSCYGSQAALFSLLMYCDDARFVCSGAARSMRLLKIFHTIIGPEGLNLPLSRAAKQQTGCCVEWLGARLATPLGLVWLPPVKALRAAAGIATTLQGDMQVGEYRRLVGFLVSILFMVGGDKSLLHHIFRPVCPGEEIDGGPATLVTVDACMRPILKRWLGLVMNTPGAAMMAALTPTAPHAATPRHRIRVDAALQGTPSPGIGGWLYGRYFALAIADWPGLELLDIPHLEFLAAGVGILTFEPLLANASLVCLETDALATATSLTNRARSPAMQAILSALLESDEYAELAPRLTCSHCWGAGNPLGDAASRGYKETMRAISAALGMPASRMAISPAAAAFLHRALARLADLRGALQQPNLGSVALGPHNIAMDGRPLAHIGGDTPPMSPDDMTDDELAPSLPQPQRRRPRTPYADFQLRPTPTSRRAPRSPASPTKAATPTAAPGGKRNGRAAGIITPTLTPPSMDATTPPPRRHSAKLPRQALFLDSDDEDKLVPPFTPRAAPAHDHVAMSPPSMGASPQVGGKPPTPTRGGAAAKAMQATRDGLKAEMLQMLRNDKSEHAINAEEHKLEWLAEVSTIGNGEEQPITTQAQRASNWRAWERYIKWLSPSLNPWRPDINTLDAVGIRRECALWAGAMIWIYARMKPAKGKYLPPGPPHFGRPKPPTPQSALAILRGVRAEHIARGVTPPPMKLATLRCHELALKYMRDVGPENCVPQRKAPLTHLLITGILAIPNDSPILNRGKTWSWMTDYGHSTRTLFHVLAQTGFRKAEVALGDGKWDASHISFANLKWKIDKKTVLYPTPAQMMSLKETDFAIIMPPPSKADQLGHRWGNNPIWLPYDPLAAVNAARALARWEICAAVKPEKRRSTPLFCGPSGVGTPLKADALDTLFQRMLTWTMRGSIESPSDYSIHSFRSYLASAMMAADCSDAQIQAALRWASEDALAIYKVANREAYGSWLTRAERVKLTGERARTLHQTHRHMPFYEMEELAGAFVAARADLNKVADTADATDPNTVLNSGVLGVLASDEQACADVVRPVYVDVN